MRWSTERPRCPARIPAKNTKATPKPIPRHFTLLKTRPTAAMALITTTAWKADCSLKRESNHSITVLTELNIISRREITTSNRIAKRKTILLAAARLTAGSQTNKRNLFGDDICLSRGKFIHLQAQMPRPHNIHCRKNIPARLVKATYTTLRHNEAAICEGRAAKCTRLCSSTDRIEVS